MHHALHIFIFILLICLATSCKPILYTVYGIKKPRQVSTAHISKKAARLNLPPDALYGIRQEKYPIIINRIGILPNVFIYDKYHRALNWQSTEDECMSRVDNFIAQLKSDSSANLKPDTTFCTAENELVGLYDGKPFSVQALPQADYYIFVYWATYLGRLNREYLTDWLTATQQNHHASFHFIFISGDLRKEWGSEYWKVWEKPVQH